MSVLVSYIICTLVVEDVLPLQSWNSPASFTAELTFQKLCFCPQNFPLAAVTEQRYYSEKQRGYRESAHCTTVDPSGRFYQLYSAVPKQSFQTANLILTRHQHASYNCTQMGFQLSRESANQALPFGDTVQVSVHFLKSWSEIAHRYYRDTGRGRSVFSLLYGRDFQGQQPFSALVYDWQRGPPSVH